jgi:hypothetical protein
MAPYLNVFRLFQLISFIHQCLYSSLLSPGHFFSFVILFAQKVGLFGRGISQSQGRYLHTEQQKHRINAHTDTHALSGIPTHDPSVRENEDSPCLRPSGHCDRHFNVYAIYFSHRHTCYMASISYPSLFDHPINVMENANYESLHNVILPLPPPPPNLSYIQISFFVLFSQTFFTARNQVSHPEIQQLKL